MRKEYKVDNSEIVFEIGSPHELWTYLNGETIFKVWYPNIPDEKVLTEEIEKQYSKFLLTGKFY